MRGARPVVTIESAKKFAERQGYCWVPNPDADIPYDALAYRDHDAIAIRVRTSRNSPGEFDMWEDFFRDDFEILKMLPMPEGIGRECGYDMSGAVPSSGTGYTKTGYMRLA